MLPHSIGSLVKLKHLFLSCWELRKLPNSIGRLESLLELHIKYAKIRKLPNSIGNLKKLKILTIPCRSLRKLPNSFGWLQSLVKLDLSWSSIRILPDCIMNLKKLKVLDLNCSRINELPKSIGMLENLEMLYAQCRDLVGEIPSEIGKLSSLKILDLVGGGFSELPTTVNQLTNLQTLDLCECHSIQQLPKLPENLRSLSFSWNSLTTTLDFSKLTNLVELYMVGRPVREPHMEGLGRLRALRELTLCVGEMVLPPTDLSSLSQLQRLIVSYADSRSLTRLPPSLQDLTLTDVQSPIDWSLFSNLENLSTLCIERYLLEEIRFEVLGKLWKFNALRLELCPLLKTLPVLPCLKEIRSLHLQELPQLIEIDGLGELKSLRDLSIWHCNSIKSLNKSDLSDLQNLKILDFLACESLESVLGVPKSCQLTVSACPRFNRDG